MEGERVEREASRAGVESDPTGPGWADVLLVVVLLILALGYFVYREPGTPARSSSPEPTAAEPAPVR